MKPIPSFLDFEASSLSPYSYPIEVAWNLADGSIESHLISPETIMHWTDWDPESEKIHTIPRQELIAHGKPPAWVCERMNEQLSGKTVYSDAPRFDGRWLMKLFSVYENPEPDFLLGNAYDCILNTLCPDIASRVYGVVKLEALILEARKRVPKQHRAAWDVEYLVEMWKLAYWDSRSDK
ncbi:MAG: hypothetical protein L0229_05720 [Blastocatellia bacterium]|nr:hypothetical protein [Blastocatellia bacterium]